MSVVCWAERHTTIVETTAQYMQGLPCAMQGAGDAARSTNTHASAGSCAGEWVAPDLKGARVCVCVCTQQGIVHCTTGGISNHLQRRQYPPPPRATARHSLSKAFYRLRRLFVLVMLLALSTLLLCSACVCCLPHIAPPPLFPANTLKCIAHFFQPCAHMPERSGC